MEIDKLNIFNLRRRLRAPKKPKRLNQNVQFMIRPIGLQELLFHYNVSKNNKKEIRVLLIAGISPNVLNAEGRSALHIAIYRGFEETIDILLKHGANPNITDNCSNTPLHVAVRKYDLDSVRKLVCAGADPTRLNSNGKSPIEHARSQLESFKPTFVSHTKQSLYYSNKLEGIIAILKLADKGRNSEITSLEECFKQINIT